MLLFPSFPPSPVHLALGLVLALLGALGLGDTAELLGTVLPLLACLENHCQPPFLTPSSTMCPSNHEKHTLLSAGLLDLLSGTDTDETEVRLELLQGLSGVVDQSEAGALATTELRAETEDGDLILVGLVEASELLTEFVLGDIGTVGVEDVTRRVFFVSSC